MGANGLIPGRTGGSEVTEHIAFEMQPLGLDVPIVVLALGERRKSGSVHSRNQRGSC